MKGKAVIAKLKIYYKYILSLVLAAIFLTTCGFYVVRTMTIYNIQHNLGALNPITARNIGYGACNTSPNSVSPKLGHSSEICGSGNDVLVLSKASANFGYRIGDKIIFKVYMMAPKSYVFNFAQLYAGNFNIYGSSFKLLDKPRVVVVQSGKNKFYKITFEAISFMANVKEPPLAFTATLAYSEKTAKGNDYGQILTAPVMVSVSNSYGYGDNLLTGSLLPVNNPGVFLSDVFLIIGFGVALGGIILAVLTFANNYIPKSKSVSANSIAWQMLDKCFNNCDNVLKIDQLRAISFAIRRYFGVLGKTTAEIEVCQIDKTTKENLIQLVSLLDKAIFAQQLISDKDFDFIKDAVAAMIPRKLHSKNKFDCVRKPLRMIVEAYKVFKAKYNV